MPSNNRRKIVTSFVIGFIVLCVIVIAGAIWLMNDPQVQADVSATSTAQALASANSAATATAQFSAIDARLANKQLILNETFDKTDSFVNQNFNDIFKGGIQNGAYQADVYITTGSPNEDRMIPLGKDLTDFVAEVDCITSDPDGYCGIAYDAQPVGDLNAKSYYVSAVGDADECDFESVLPTGWSTNKRSLCTAANAKPNHVRVERLGQYLRFYVNGQLVDQRELKDGMSSGDVAIFMGAYTPDSFAKTIEITVDNFQVWQVP